MPLLTGFLRVVVLALLLAGGTASFAATAFAQSAPPPTTTAAQDEYLPISELPDSEKLPAAPFLVAAYIIVWVALLLYVLSLRRRLDWVEADLREARRLTSGGR